MLLKTVILSLHFTYIYRERDKERDRQTDRETDRKTDTQTHTQTERNRNQIRSFIYPLFDLKLDTLALELDCMRFNKSIDDE